MRITLLVSKAAAFAVAVTLTMPLVAPGASTKAQRRRKPAAAKKAAPSWPSFELRREDFIRRVRGANASGNAAPDPLSQFLVSEIIVTGIFETESGHGVFLHALPSGRTFDARPGATLYNGHLVEILISNGFNDEGSVVFLERAPQSATERQVTKKLERAPERTELAPATPPAASSATP